MKLSESEESELVRSTSADYVSIDYTEDPVRKQFYVDKVKYMYVSPRSILHSSVDVRVLGIWLKYLWARKQTGVLGEKYNPRCSQT